MLTGVTSSQAGGENAFLIKTDSEGNTWDDKMTPVPREISRWLDIISLVGFFILFFGQIFAIPVLVLIILFFAWKRYKRKKG